MKEFDMTDGTGMVAIQPPAASERGSSIAKNGRRIGPRRLAGHGRITEPLGPSRARQPTTAGWRAACICGWSDPRTHQTRIEAERAYIADHLTVVYPICRRCQQPKSRAAMSKGSPNMCKPCRTASTKEWAAANPSAWERHSRKSYLKRRYGTTPEVVDALLLAQGGVCAACGSGDPGDSRGFRPHIDHCHKTGKIRGILCGPCNQGMGCLGDSPDRLILALAYLIQHADDPKTLVLVERLGLANLPGRLGLWNVPDDIAEALR